MKNLFFNAKRLGILVIVLLCSTRIHAQAQTGKIAGTISDAKTAETLIGVSVKIKQTQTGASTDVQGRYFIQALKPGKYTLVVSYIGYQSKEISEVEVKGNETTNLSIQLNEQGNQLNEVVIRANFKQESVNALYSQQKNSASISDGISADLIKKSPDKNTGEVLKRISGATIQDNKFVVVRGLSDRYNSATLDQSALPSTEVNRKAFSFDIVPSNLIDKITITKTATPDMPADFAGGAVQIITKDIPDEDFVSFGMGYGYNSSATSKPFLTTHKSFMNYTGFTDRNSLLADNFPSRNKIAAGLSESKNKAVLLSLPNDFSVQNRNALPSQNYQFNLGRVKQFENNNRLGAMLALTYRNGENINGNVQRKFHTYDYLDNQYKFSTNLGALLNLAYAFKGNQISFKNIYNRNFDDNYTERTGTNTSSTSRNRFFAFDLVEKSLLKSSLEGTHQLGGAQSKLKWNASWSHIENNQPNQLKINYVKGLNASEQEPYQANVTSLGKENTRLFTELNENIFAADLNYSMPFKLFNTQTIFKSGLGGQYRERSFDARFIGMELNVHDADQLTAIRSLPVDQIFNPNLINAGLYKLGEVGRDEDSYTANASLAYAYLMLDQKLAAKHRLIYGLRVEHFRNQLFAGKTNVDQSIIDVLPSVNYTYSITDKANLRASYYRTLARPEFRELAPGAFYDYELLAVQTGNPNLKRSLIDNADIRYEWYPKAGEILSVSAFYKHFNNAIETYRYDVNSTPDISYFNTPSAYSYGIELEIRKKLSFIAESDFLNNTSIYSNLAFIKSQVTNPTDQNYIDQVRPMVGQSPYVINAGLQHEALKNTLSFSVLYNKVGRRIVQASGINFPSTWENPRDVLDLQVGYKTMKKRAEIKLNVSDVFNQRNVVYFDYDLNKKFQSNGKDEVISAYKSGVNVSLSLNYKF